MPDGLGGAGIGAGGGAAAAAVAYVLDKIYGSGKSAKNFNEQFREFRDELEKGLAGLVKLSERANVMAQKLLDWHDVNDPDDPAGKIWYFSVSLRKVLATLDTRVSRLLELLDDLVRRFDRYNETLEKLITVTEKLQTDVSALGIVVSGMDRGRR